MVRVFFSYSHADERMRDQIEKQLELLKRQGVIETWHDRRIPAGNDLHQMLIRDLSMGGVIRQHRETDYAGNFMKKPAPRRRTASGAGNATMKSAFDDTEFYELTELGAQYAMVEITARVEFKTEAESEQ